MQFYNDFIQSFNIEPNVALKEISDHMAEAANTLCVGETVHIMNSVDSNKIERRKKLNASLKSLVKYGGSEDRIPKIVREQIEKARSI
jgi:hypothetical protein